MDTSIAAFPDVEGGLKTWLKAQSAISAFVGSRVFLGMPRRGPSAYPVLSLYRIGGGPEDKDYPSDLTRVQINVWGNSGDKTGTWQTTQAVVRALLAFKCGTLFGNSVRALGAYGFSINYVPDPNTGRPRYVVGFILQAQATV